MADGPKPTVVGLVVLMDADGNFGTFLSVPDEHDAEKYPMPSRDTLDAITRMLTFEWAADIKEEGTPNGE